MLSSSNWQLITYQLLRVSAQNLLLPRWFSVKAMFAVKLTCLALEAMSLLKSLIRFLSLKNLGFTFGPHQILPSFLRDWTIVYYHLVHAIYWQRWEQCPLDLRAHVLNIVTKYFLKNKRKKVCFFKHNFEGTEPSAEFFLFRYNERLDYAGAALHFREDMGRC